MEAAIVNAQGVQELGARTSHRSKSYLPGSISCKVTAQVRQGACKASPVIRIFEFVDKVSKVCAKMCSSQYPCLGLC